MNVQIDKHLEKKSCLLVKDELFEVCLANTHLLPIFSVFSICFVY